MDRAVLNSTSGVLFNAADLAALTPFKSHAQLALRRNAIAEYTIRAREQLKAAGLQVIELPALFIPELERPRPIDSRTNGGRRWPINEGAARSEGSSI